MLEPTMPPPMTTTSAELTSDQCSVPAPEIELIDVGLIEEKRADLPSR